MCAEMNPPIAQTVAAELWCQIMVGMGLSTAASKQWKPMDHMNRSTSAKGEQDNVFMSASRTVISNAVKRLLNGYFGKKSPTASYALWSGGGAAREFAQRQGHTVLEGTQAGALFDTLANTLNTPPVSKWGIVKVLWEELSRMYARQCSLDQVDGYLRSADPSSIFARIEFETLRARAQAAGKKLNIKLHAIGAETKTSDDRSVTVDELKILGSSTNLPGVAAYIERNDSLIRRNKVVGQAASLEDPAVGN